MTTYRVTLELRPDRRSVRTNVVTRVEATGPDQAIEKALTEARQDYPNDLVALGRVDYQKWGSWHPVKVN